MRTGLPLSTRMHIKNPPEGPKEIEELLDRSLDWDFDIFGLEVLTDKRCFIII